MKHKLLIILLTLSVTFSNAQGWMWAKHFSGVGQNQPVCIITDASGSSYVYGNFTSTVTQDAFTLISSGPQDIFLAKYNKQGQCLWLKQFGGASSETAMSISLSNDGNFIYFSGQTNSNPCTFDGNNITSNGLNDIFLTMYDTNGTFQWVKNMAYGADQQIFGNFTIDNNGNIILTGHFLTSVTFNGGITTLTSLSPGIRQSFISKFDQNGNLFWAKMLPGDNSANTIRSVSSEVSGYYISGIFAGNLTLDIGVIASSGGNDGFLYKTDTAGNGQWVRKIAGTGTDIIWRHRSDYNNNQYLTGYFNSPKLKIDSTSTDTSKANSLNINTGTNDIFLIKYNANGNLQWVKTMGTTKDEASFNLDVVNDNSVITGSFDGKIGFDNITLINLGASDAFFAECNSNGQFVSANKASGKLNDLGKASAYSKTGRNFITVGEFFSDTLTIGLNQFVNSNTSARDAYIAKYGCFDSIHFDVTPMSCIDGGGMPSLDGVITATPSDGNAPYTYIWSNGATTQTISNLDLGIYTCTVSGTNGCTLTSSATVTLKPFLASITNIINVACSGQSTGSATVTATLGNAPYSYLWSNGATSSTISNVPAGNYFVTVSDQCGTTIVTSANITTNPVVNSTISGTNITCRGGNNGSATASPFNGSSPYSYIWSNSAITQTITNLIAGTYRVTVKDACNNTVIKSITLTQPAALTLGILVVPTSPCANTGQLTALPSNGTSPYTFLWTTGATTQTISNLGTGTYRVTITDACGATKRQSATINVSSGLSATTSITASSPSCDGTATVNPSGGGTPYSYVWNNGQTTQTAINLCIGTYSVTVTDNCGTTVIRTVNVTSYSPLDATINGTNITCRGGNNGTAAVSPFNGHSPYYYSWSNGATTQTINTLVAATYIVTVTDSWSASVIKSITLTQPAALSVGVLVVPTSPCINTGQLTALPSNGTSPYTYKWNTGPTTQSIFNLASGSYTVTVTDACGATKRRASTVTIKTINITTTSTCSSPLCNGSITANVTGGDAPFTYLWNNGQTTQTAINLCSGTYRVTVTDVNGCTKRKTNITVGACLKSLETTDNENYISSEINVFPNPASTTLNINFAEQDNTFVKLKVYNLLGECVSIETYKEFSGTTLIKDISNYSKGLYLLKLTLNEKEFTRRVIIQ